MTLEAPIADRAGRDRQQNPRGDLVDILLLPQAQDFSNEPLPKTSAAIIARPTKSLVLYSQMVGRIIRGEKVEGTKKAEIWTVVDQQLPGFRNISEAFWNWEDVW